jgi:CheY-like chemotaxis protein
MVKLEVIFNKNNKNSKLIDLIISVSDTGIGVLENERQRIFKPFEQQQNQDTREYGGTGLGLAISQRIVELLNGTIELETEYGIGSNFTVKIPEVICKKTVNFKKAKNPKRACFNKEKILLIDDISNNLFVLKGMLEALNLSPVTAESGKEALCKLKKENTDFKLILTDLWMPEFSGYELVKKVREFDKNIPFIAVTADTEILKDKNRKVFDGIIIKPYTLSDLEKILKDYFKDASRSNEKAKKMQKLSRNRENEMLAVQAILSENEINHLKKEKTNFSKRFKEELIEMKHGLDIQAGQELCVLIKEFANEINSPWLMFKSDELKNSINEFMLSETYRIIDEITDVFN